MENILNKSIVSTFVFVAAMGLSASSYAFSMGGLMGGGSGSSGGGANLSATQNKTAADYVAGNLLVISANTEMAQALNLDGTVATLKASSDALKAGTSEDSIKASDVAVSKSTEEISNKLKSNPKLDAASKSHFAAGLVALVSGAVSYAKVGKDLTDSKSAVSSASPMDLMKLGELVYITKTAPGNMKNLSDALTTAISFAKGQGIPAPANVADATSALGAM